MGSFHASHCCSPDSQNHSWLVWVHHRSESRLDVLFNSAGVMWCLLDQVTTQGYDMQFGTNVLGHFYLTQLLLPTLLASAESSPDKHVRVVNVASNGHWGAPIAEKGGPILYDTLIDGPERTKFGNTTVLYFQSKAVRPAHNLPVILLIYSVLYSPSQSDRVTLCFPTLSPGSAVRGALFPPH